MRFISAPTRPWSLAAAAGLCGLAAALMCLAAPIRAQSGDPVPGRLEALTLACHGTFDLREVDWLAEQARGSRVIYYVHRSAGGALVSAFGPAPALMAAPGMLSLKGGAVVGYRAVLRRARYGASVAIGLSACLLCLAIGATASVRRAIAGTLVAALSFAGCGTLGQGPWQQTAALPFLVAALAVLAWVPRRPRLWLLFPPLLTLAFYVRPASIGALGGLLLAGSSLLARDPRGRRAAGLGCLFAVVAAVPFALWCWRYFGAPLPLGQEDANVELAHGAALWSFSPTHMGRALVALVASPGRGLLFYAPVALLAVPAALRQRGVKRLLLAGLALQLLVLCPFFNWWGGVSYGPRLLAEAAWMGTWLLFSDATAWRPAWRNLVAVAAVSTVIVGAIGLARFDPRAWELRQGPEPDFWQVRDNPISALVTREIPTGEQLRDMPDGPYAYCSDEATLARVQPR
jgi:hypothetical protein